MREPKGRGGQVSMDRRSLFAEFPLAGLELALDFLLARAEALAQARELEDLEYVDQIQARADRQQAERDQHQRPAQVEVSVVVRVRNEPQRERERSQHERPAV